MNDNIDLKKLRTNAGLSQIELARLLDIQQSQVSRYEDDPDSISRGLEKKWRNICGEQQTSMNKIDIIDPRTELKYLLHNTKDYLSTPPVSNSTNKEEYLSIIKNITTVLTETIKKKKIGVFGQYDAGKSRLINELIGTNNLPTSYQPTTSVVCLIKHMNDKPIWQAENVWLMKKGFDLQKADNQYHCEEFKALAGSYEALSQHGIHHLSNQNQENLNIDTAIVYIDAPILLAVDIIDLPGYGNDQDDSEKAEMIHAIADAAIYLSPFAGFMNQSDHMYFTSLLKNIPLSPTLDNIFIIASRAPTSENESIIETVLDKASIRLFRNTAFFKEDLNIPEEILRKRFFSFSADEGQSHLSQKFIHQFISYITNNIPANQKKVFENYLSSIKVDTSSIISKQINEWQNILLDRSAVLDELMNLKSNQNDIFEKFDDNVTSVSKKIHLYKQESLENIRDIFEQMDLNTIEQLINDTYTDKKEAKQYATNLIITKLESKINKFNKIRAEKLAEDIDLIMDEFDTDIKSHINSNIALNLDFNTKAAFISALSGIGTVGALSVWASIVAGGSNLGAYILIGKIVGWLSSIGISLGGSATVMTVVSALGGPITLGIALGAIVALGIYSLFGGSWQLSLAKKIIKTLEKENIESKFSTSIQKYWNETISAFTQATNEFKHAYSESIITKEKSLHEINTLDLLERIDTAKKYLDFFQHIH